MLLYVIWLLNIVKDMQHNHEILIWVFGEYFIWQNALYWLSTTAMLPKW